MLDILGQSYKLCDGLSRRSFLKIGGLAMGGLSLPEILRAEASSGVSRRSHKAVIMIFLAGGPPHQDMFDLKPHAPVEVRGEFSPIKTNVSGIEICELFPKLASMTDRLAIIRSIVGAAGPHYAEQCLSGHSSKNQPIGGWPSLGSVLAKAHGPVNNSVPPFVGLSPKTSHVQWGDPGQPGFLGASYAPFRPNGEGREDMVLNGISLERLGDRRQLLSTFDRFRREADSSGLMSGLDTFNQQAFGVLTSSRLAEALDITREDPAIVESYGKGNPNPTADGPPKMMEHFLIARRLVEAGCRCVTLAFSRWDWHGNNFGRARTDFPMLDQGLSALLNDLYQRGLERDVSVVVWGEFGRTPMINAAAGRDHWPQVSCALLAGGGMRTGQVIGATDKIAGEAVDRPVHFQDVFATLYHNLGIDVDTFTLNDLNGRPQYLVDNDKYRPLRELV